MKVSLNWIKDYVCIPDDMPLSKIAYDLTMSTVEVEGMTVMSEEYDNIVVGVVRELVSHPNADKLTICKTDIGGGDVREIVCGGINLREGMKVAVAKPGAMVRWHGEGEPVEIKNAKLRGVESYGMICASSEIGLFDLFPYTEEATIVDLSSFDAEAGANLADALGLNDVILEIDNKSLTNRPDLWGHYGIAREISALYDLPLRGFEAYTPQSTPDFEITIDDTGRCPRYVGVRIEGLDTRPSPFEIQSRIWRVGMRPINAIVDITNYVMLSTGQPTHAFDSDNIKGHIIVRRAGSEEKLELLDGKELTLCPEDLVIADEENAVGLAGVMGGVKDSVLQDTSKVILEIANFEALGIRRTATRYEVRTEAAARNEKGIDPERCDIALSQAMRLFAEIYPGMAATGFRDVYPKPLQRSEVEVSLDWLERRLGKRIPNDEISRMLENLGFEVEFYADPDAGGSKDNSGEKPGGGSMRLIAPTWRSTGDISIPNDIMEEVARMHGLENFEPTSIAASFDGAINQQDIDIDRKIREYLAVRCGMQEVYTYPWVGDEYVNTIQGSFDGMLEMTAPPSPDERRLRSSLLPGLCKAAAGNAHNFDEFAIFESAQVFFDGSFSSEYDPRESLPHQHKSVAGAFVGSLDDVNALFRRAKGAIEALPRYVHAGALSFSAEEKPVWADNVLWLNIVSGDSGDGNKPVENSDADNRNGENSDAGSRDAGNSGTRNSDAGKSQVGEKLAGNLALLSRKAALDCGIKNSAVMLFEMNMDELIPLTSRTNRFTRLPEYPMTDYDVSMLFSSDAKWEEILGVITSKKNADDLLRGVSFVGEYRGRQVPDGKKSVTFRLAIGSLNKTLTAEEIETCAAAIVKRLGKTLGAELRS